MVFRNGLRGTLQYVALSLALVLGVGCDVPEGTEEVPEMVPQTGGVEGLVNPTHEDTFEDVDDIFDETHYEISGLHIMPLETTLQGYVMAETKKFYALDFVGYNDDLSVEGPFASPHHDGVLALGIDWDGNYVFRAEIFDYQMSDSGDLERTMTRYAYTSDALYTTGELVGSVRATLEDFSAFVAE